MNTTIHRIMVPAPVMTVLASAERLGESTVIDEPQAAAKRIDELTAALESCVTHLDGLPDPEHVAQCTAAARAVLAKGAKP